MKGIKLLQIFSVFTEELSVSPDIAEQIVYVFGMQSRFASGWLTGGIPGEDPGKKRTASGYVLPVRRQ